MTVSIVVASRLGPPFIERCLDAIAPQVRGTDAEVLVATSNESGQVERLGRAFPWVRLVECHRGTSVPALRRRGVERAAKDVVALTEERCVPSPDWLRTLRAALARGTNGVVGGPVAAGDYGSVRDWAVYFCEYHAYLPGLPILAAAPITTVNAAYRRDVLIERLDLLDDGYWELVLHPRLRREGVRFLFEPAMVVFKQGGFEFGPYLRQRFWFSRAFAGARAEGGRGGGGA